MKEADTPPRSTAIYPDLDWQAMTVKQALNRYLEARQQKLAQQDDIEFFYGYHDRLN